MRQKDSAHMAKTVDTTTKVQNYNERDANNSDIMKERDKYVEETVTALTMSLYTLHGQLFDLEQEVFLSHMLVNRVNKA